VTVRTRVRRSLPFVIAIIGGFLAAYLIVAFLVFPSGVIPRDVQVPNVTGLPFDDAVRRLAERGLRGVRGEERFHAASPKGTVLEQVPAAGARDIEGATITLAVSIGQKTARVPTLIGRTQDEAQRALEGAGFDVGDVSERPNDAPPGEVIDSRPAAGNEAPVPSAVALVISAGPNVALVPNVIGQSVAAARALIEGAGLVISDVRTPSGVPVTDENAIVTDQTPKPGAQVAAGSSVQLLAMTRGSR
jgi:serine/threonine-protein kinase